jgi:acetyl esterase/lipase
MLNRPALQFQTLCLTVFVFVFVFSAAGNRLLGQVRPESSAAEVDDGIWVEKDVAYAAGGDPSNTLDIFVPNTPNPSIPLIVLIHGGGWNAGSKTDFDGACLDLVRHGYAAASINYRLSSQAIFPAQIIDCKAAIRWLRANAKIYGFDPKHIVVGGHSAGGHLAAFMGVSNGANQFDQGGFLRYSSNVQAVIWCAGVGNLLTRAETPGYEGEESAGSGESMLIGGALLQNQDKALKASPITYVSKKTVPFAFFHGDVDKMVPVSQATDMYAAIRSRGVYSELHIIPGADHGGPGYFTISMWQEVDRFLSKVLKTQLSSMPKLSAGADYSISPVGAPSVSLSDLSGGAVGLEPSTGVGSRWVFSPEGGGLYSIRPVDNRALALTVTGGAAVNTTPVVLSQFSGQGSQLWSVFRDAITGEYSLLPKCAPDSALDDLRGNPTPEAKIDIFSFNYTDPHLQWILTPGAALQSAN